MYPPSTEELPVERLPFRYRSLAEGRDSGKEWGWESLRETPEGRRFGVTAPIKRITESSVNEPTATPQYDEKVTPILPGRNTDMVQRRGPSYALYSPRDGQAFLPEMWRLLNRVGWHR